MKVKRLKCNTEHNISIDKIPAGGARATCRKCGNKIKVLPSRESKENKDTHIQSQSVSPAKTIEESKDQQKAVVEVAFADITDVRLWNPNAIGCWSLLFSPLFGSILTFMNWRALGADKEAKEALVWILYSTLALVAFLFLLDAVLQLLGRAARAPHTVAPAAAVYIYILALAVPLGIEAFILIWHFFSNRPQAEYFRIELNNQYIRKKWGKPFGLALGGLVGYLVCIFMVISIGLLGLYAQRGLLWAILGAHERAIVDFTKALEIDPSDADIFVWRGDLWDDKGDHDRAIADYSKAIELDPNNAPLYKKRGNAFFYQARFALAAADYKRYLRMKPKDIYRMLWLYMAQEKGGKSGLHELSDNIKHVDLTRWPGPVAYLFLERISPEELLVETKDNAQRVEKERQCEAYFYLGEYYLLRNAKEKAAQMFRLCLETKLTPFFEYKGAKVELERMGLE